MKVIRLLKIITVNAVIFILLLILVNWICGFFLKRTAKSTRDTLPNYAADHAYAKAVFNDYNRVQHRYEPFVGWKTLPYTGQTTHINKNGNRVHVPPAHSEEKDTTVHFFGGSTMWGEGSDDQHTIPALFNKAFPQYEVFNHGQLAYNTRQEVDALISLYSKKINPDLVIFYDGVNDAAFLCPKEINDLPAHRLVPFYRERIYVGRSTLLKEILNKTFLANIIQLINRSSDQEKKASPYNCISDPEKAEEIAEIMMRNWELAHEIVTRRGGKFIAVLQPAAFIGNPRIDHLTLDQDLKENFVAVYNQLKAKIAARNHPWIHDLSAKFDGSEYIYVDFCHVSPNGNEIMAEAIADIIKSNLDTTVIEGFQVKPPKAFVGLRKKTY